MAAYGIGYGSSCRGLCGISQPVEARIVIVRRISHTIVLIERLSALLRDDDAHRYWRGKRLACARLAAKVSRVWCACAFQAGWPGPLRQDSASGLLSTVSKPNWS